MANGSIEDEFSKFEAEIAQLSAPAPTVQSGPSRPTAPAVVSQPPMGPSMPRQQTRPMGPQAGPQAPYMPRPMGPGPVAGPMMPNMQAYPHYMPGPQMGMAGPMYPGAMGTGMAGPWMPQAQTAGPGHSYPTDEQIAQMNAANANQETEGPKKSKKKKVDPKLVRHAAGATWIDETLGEWDPEGHRIFCGDLGNDVNDDQLARMFNQYPSFQKARVIRDKRTGKTRGYGFVSFKDPKDFLRAMKEMNGKYCGHRPLKLRKSNWDERIYENRKAKGDVIKMHRKN